jgi:hypothetical protein
MAYHNYYFLSSDVSTDIDNHLGKIHRPMGKYRHPMWQWYIDYES